MAVPCVVFGNDKDSFDQIVQHHPPRRVLTGVACDRGAEVPEEMFSNFAARTLVLGDLVVDFGGGVASVEFSRAICSNFCASSFAEGVLMLAVPSAFRQR